MLVFDIPYLFDLAWNSVKIGFGFQIVNLTGNPIIFMQFFRQQKSTGNAGAACLLLFCFSPQDWIDTL